MQCSRLREAPQLSRYPRLRPTEWAGFNQEKRQKRAFQVENMACAMALWQVDTRSLIGPEGRLLWLNHRTPGQEEHGEAGGEEVPDREGALLVTLRIYVLSCRG